jgi:glycosyltransferase involved in cell wall biosynthesis
MKATSVTSSISRLAGGLPQSIRRLDQCLNELPETKVSVAALRDKYSEQDVTEWFPLSVSLSSVFGPRALGFSTRLLPKLLESNADIMHTHGLWQYPSMAVNRWHKKTGRPYLVSTHGMLDPWAVQNSAWKKRMALAIYERRHLEEAACLRALCEAEAQAIREFGLHNPICIIPNGMDIPEDQKEEYTKQNAPWKDSTETGRKILLYLGRIHPKKGLVNLIKAWAMVQKSEVRSQKSEWTLAIAGWDQNAHELDLKHLCEELGVPFIDIRTPDSKSGKLNSILFLGPQFGDLKAACYANCDAFILPSYSEGLPMVVLEAWAYGKPVLMTPQCNLPQGFAAGAAIRIETGVESIAAGLNFLMQASDNQIELLGKNGRSLVATNFDWPHIAREMAQVYQWLLGNGEKPACVV